jgi:hypothetical protein
VFLTWPPALAQTASAGGSGSFSRIEGTCLGVDTYRMAKKPEPPKPISWNVYNVAPAKPSGWRGQAPDEAAAVEKGAREFKVPATKLMAIRR